MKKKIFSFTAFLMLAFCLACSDVFAASKTKAKSGAAKSSSGEEFVVELTADLEGARIVKYTGKSPDVVIPKTIQGLPVLEVADFFCGVDSAKKNKTVKSIVFPDTVRTIGGLSGYVALESVVLPENLEKISCAVVSSGKSCGMFEGCSSLKSINLPSSIRRIERDSFKGCSSLETVMLEEGWECDFAESAFTGCSKIQLIYQRNLKRAGYKGRF